VTSIHAIALAASTEPSLPPFKAAGALIARLDREIGRVIIGQQQVRRDILTCLFAGGHCLLRGVPGLAKTLLIKTLADAVSLKFSRIQFTPDLMPSDILGTEVIEDDATGGTRHVRFIPGPIFANIILADEINRTPPRTQAALLEAMQEYQVTVGGVRYGLERPLFVLATDNPIEQEGTYPLPEAQLDRFMFNVVIDYPDADDERRILAETTTAADRTVSHVATGADLEAAGVKAMKWPIIREGILVGLQTNRETAHLIGEEFSRGCTFGNSWRDYPFLRMPNVHLEPGPANSPTREQLISDVKNGVIIDGRGSYSIDQQRYNGQFGGHIFWEVKHGKITRQVTDVPYNAITTDFWGNLDGITGPSEYQKHGTGGDAKGQPTQTNSISHGSPWLLIRKMMVGAAFD